jgi:hypothetical protein
LIHSNIYDIKCVNNIEINNCCQNEFNEYKFNISYYNQTDDCFILNNQNNSIKYLCNLKKNNKFNSDIKWILLILLGFIFLYTIFKLIYLQCFRVSTYNQI